MKKTMKQSNWGLELGIAENQISLTDEKLMLTALQQQ